MTVAARPALVDHRLTKRFDLALAALTLALVGLGLVALRSIEVEGVPTYFRKQIAWALIGGLGMLAGAWLGHERLQRRLAHLYVLNIALLTAVLIAGHETKGSLRWFAVGSFRMQPSEFAKLFVILTLAALFHKYRERVDKPGTVLLSLAHIAVPMVLILRQPDLGTSLSLVAIWFGMAFIAGVPLRYLGAVLVCGALLFGLAARTGMIREYQLKRLWVCFNPGADPRGAGYQVNQARIAIGSGRVFGKGMGHGTQSQGEFIPERQTDFVFTVLAEEGGFLLTTATVALFGALVPRGWHIVGGTSDGIGRLVGAGVLSMVSFHGLVNMAMNMGLGPVTGVPLPLISYGGSSMLVTLTGIGLILGVGIRRDPLVF
ncbi:MAG: rod shape-determining protein RodA [Armatimonadetes bacterium]|nr:rod shape-determining protein RodA [Armatimonadota bacterium]